MKIRTDFVTNSSSSSFVAAISVKSAFFADAVRSHFDEVDGRWDSFEVCDGVVTLENESEDGEESPRNVEEACCRLAEMMAVDFFDGSGELAKVLSSQRQSFVDSIESISWEETSIVSGEFIQWDELRLPDGVEDEEEWIEENSWRDAERKSSFRYDKVQGISEFESSWSLRLEDDDEDDEEWLD